MEHYFTIVGKVPPPIGGVRIHVSRLIKFLKNEGFNFKFVPLSGRKIITSIVHLLRAKFIHLHTSNVWVRLCFSIFCLFIGKKLLITYHGNIGRFGRLLNLFDLISIKLAYLPIVLNMKSLNIAMSVNRNSRLISAFIPPSIDDSKESLAVDFVAKLKNLKCDFLFCTNAYGLTYDKLGQEIYGILSLVKIFNSRPNMGLVISDPSGSYFRHFKKNKTKLNQNIIVLDFPHSFIHVIKNTDCMIRSTTTDGDSISVREALYYGKPVIASDCVERPQGCILFHSGDFSELDLIIGKFTPSIKIERDEKDFTGLTDLLTLYAANLNQSTK